MHLDFKYNLLIRLQAFLGICLFIISKCAALSDLLLWFLWIEFKVMGQLIGIILVGVTTHKT